MAVVSVCECAVYPCGLMKLGVCGLPLTEALSGRFCRFPNIFSPRLALPHRQHRTTPLPFVRLTFVKPPAPGEVERLDYNSADMSERLAVESDSPAACQTEGERHERAVADIDFANSGVRSTQ